MDDRQAIFGAAKLLNQYGYQQNPFRAIGAYNGGPGNPQSGYAHLVLSEAQRLAPQLKGVAPAAQNLTAAPQGQGQGAGFDQAGFDKAMRAYEAVSAFKSASRADPWHIGHDPVLGLLQLSKPTVAQYTTAQSSLQQLAGPTVLNAHPAVQSASPSNLAGGFLPQGAHWTPGRRDQGRDGATNPGGPIIAPGDGYVVRIGSDPAGFGPRYPIVHFTSGPFAGRTLYVGHTLAAVASGQRFRAGTVLSYTGTSGVGNATTPGWVEIGYADSGSPGPMGQPVPF
jgi:hypothetical protein